MRRTLALAVLVGYVAGSLGPSASEAHADTLSFASGHESNGSEMTCFNWVEANGTVGLTRNPIDGCNRHYFVPLYWRTFLGAGANRSISMTYRRASGTQFDCSVFVYDAAGGLATAMPFTTPVTGSNYNTVSVNVTGVVSTGTSFVVCSIYDPPAGVHLLKINWTP